MLQSICAYVCAYVYFCPSTTSPARGVLSPHIISNLVLLLGGFWGILFFLNIYVHPHWYEWVITCIKSPRYMIRIISSEVYFACRLWTWMKLWSTVNAAGMRDWILILYSGARCKIWKQFLSTPKICSMTFCACACWRLNSSYLFWGLDQLLNKEPIKFTVL